MTLFRGMLKHFVPVFPIMFRFCSCFDKGSPTKPQRRTRQYRKVLWVELVYCLLIEVHDVSER